MEQASTKPLTGAYNLEVKYSVDRPMINPPTLPAATQRKAEDWVAVTVAATPSILKDSGR